MGDLPYGPLGERVSTTPATRPEPITLQGRNVTLEPLKPSHIDDLYACIGGPSNAKLWDYMLDGPYLDQQTFKATITHRTSSTDPLFFTIINNTTREAVGSCSLHRIDTANRVIEVGHVIFSPSLQRTPAATESIFLVAKHVFEDLGYRRFEWKCNDFNVPSKRAALRLGFSFEGVFRRHMIIKGRSRDTAWFALVDKEWARVKAGFERWLSEENFDGEGRQRERLENLMGG
ncbi:MAG: hypothetical protein Q9217_004173 [Psora testacea]